MAKNKAQMSPWEKLPDHGWKTVYKVRQDPDGEVIEEVAGERAATFAFFLAWVACAAGWWWQATLDSWPRGVVIVLTTLLTVYLVIVTTWLVTMQLIARFVRNV